MPKSKDHAICEEGRGRPENGGKGAGKALYIAGQLAAAQGDIDRAREHLSAALAICGRLSEGLYRPPIARLLETLPV